MSWDSNRDKGEWVRNPWKKKHTKRRMLDEMKEDEPLSDLRWDLEQEQGKARSHSEAAGSEDL